MGLSSTVGGLIMVEHGTLAGVLAGLGAGVVNGLLVARLGVTTLSVYSHLFESDLDPIMDGLEASHRADVARNKRGTNVIPISEAKQ